MASKLVSLILLFCGSVSLADNFLLPSKEAETKPAVVAMVETKNLADDYSMLIERTDSFIACSKKKIKNITMFDIHLVLHEKHKLFNYLACDSDDYELWRKAILNVKLTGDEMNKLNKILCPGTDKTIDLTINEYCDPEAPYEMAALNERKYKAQYGDKYEENPDYLLMIEEKKNSHTNFLERRRSFIEHIFKAQADISEE